MENERRPASRVALALGLIVAVILLGMFVAVGVASTALPGCQSCHFKNADFKTATTATAHSQVSCVECHVQTDSVLPRTKFGVYEVYGMWLPILDPTSTDVVSVKDDRCMKCHEVIEKEIVQSSGLRIKHSSCAKSRECVDCHSRVGHGSATRWPRVFSMNDCVTCHKEERVTLACTACHVGRTEDRPLIGAEYTVTHGPTWMKTHGMGQMSSCSVCHQAGSCSRCHGPGVPHTPNFVSDHSAIAVQRDAKCSMCHDKSFCIGCHQMEMPHPPTFKPAHSSLVKRDGDAKCLRCHLKADCSECHESHIHPGGSVGPIPAPATGGN